MRDVRRIACVDQERGRIVRIHRSGVERKTNLVVTLSDSANTGVLDIRIVLRVPAGRYAYVICAARKVDFQRGILAVVIVVAGNHLPALVVQRDHGIQQRRVIHSLGQDFDSELAGLIELELIHVDIDVVRPVQVLAVQDVVIAGERGFRRAYGVVGVFGAPHDRQRGQIVRVTKSEQVPNLVHGRLVPTAAEEAGTPVLGVVHQRQASASDSAHPARLRSQAEKRQVACRDAQTVIGFVELDSQVLAIEGEDLPGTLYLRRSDQVPTFGGEIVRHGDHPVESVRRGLARQVVIFDSQRRIVWQVAVSGLVDRPRPLQREVEREERFDRPFDDQALRPGAIAEDRRQGAADIVPHVDRRGEAAACVTGRNLEVGLNRLVLVADPQPERSGAEIGQVVGERQHRLVRGRIVIDVHRQQHRVVSRIGRVLRHEELVEFHFLGRRGVERVVVEVDLNPVADLVQRQNERRRQRVERRSGPFHIDATADRRNRPRGEFAADRDSYLSGNLRRSIPWIPL